MAYISALEDEEEKAPQPGPVVKSSALTATTPAGPVAQQQQPAPTASRFVNFSRFLNANRDAAQNTAKQITGDISRQGDQVQNDTQKAQQQFGSAVQAGTVKYDPTTYGEAVQNGRTPPDLQALSQAKYSGPGALSDNADWQQLNDRARKVQDTANATASSGGIGAVLQERNRGAYSDGNRRLDSALTGYVGADQFAGARERYGKMSDALNAANTASEQTAGQARGASEAARAQYATDLKTREDEQSTAATSKLVQDVDAYFATMGGKHPATGRPLDLHYLLENEAVLRGDFERRFGAGSWQRYIAAKGGT